MTHVIGMNCDGKYLEGICKSGEFELLKENNDWNDITLFIFMLFITYMLYHLYKLYNITRTLTAYIFYIRKIPTIKGRSHILAVRVLDITHITYLVWHCSVLYTAFIHGNNILL